MTVVHALHTHLYTDVPEGTVASGKFVVRLHITIGTMNVIVIDMTKRKI